jgi:ABC-2 type transport system permease protein
MAKFWEIAIHEYTRHVFRRRFVFALFSLPAFILAAGLISLLAVRAERSDLPVGVVDRAGVLERALPTPFAPFVDAAQVEAALQRGEIQGYYLLEEDFQQTRQAQLVANKPLSAAVLGQFSGQVRQELVAELPPKVAERISGGSSLTVRSADGSRQFGPGDWPNLFLPVGLFFVFMLAIFSTSGYLMQAVSEEKENRTMEIVVTSVTPGKLMAGKIAGSLAIGLTQLLAWVGVILVAVWIGISTFGFPGSIRISPGLLSLSLVTLLLAFIIISAMMAAVGAVVAEATEGQQITGPFSLPFILPFLFFTRILIEPNSPLAVALSLIPFTAPVTLTLRLSLVPVPAWQIALSLAILALTALLSLWLAGRLFRLGMLRYGQTLGWRQLLGFSCKAGAD